MDEYYQCFVWCLTEPVIYLMCVRFSCRTQSCDCKYKCDRYTDKDDNGQIDPSVLAMVGKYMYISVDGCEPPIFMTITRYI